MRYRILSNIFLFLILDKPAIESKPTTTVNETDMINITRNIDSYPLSNIFWYNGSELFKVQRNVRTATLIIENASCTDTNNFTLAASNSVQENVTAIVELRVNCKFYYWHLRFYLSLTTK